MNPAALRNELDKLEPGGTIILNSDAFVERDLAKAGYAFDPRDDGTLNGYRVIKIPMTELTKEAVKPAGVKPRDAERSKNLFALGVISWMYSRPLEPTIDWLKGRFGKNPQVLEANTLAFQAGHAFGETAELADHRYEIHPAEQTPGVYTSINGNTAMAWGMVAAGVLAKMPVFLGLLPDHPGVGHPPRAVQAQELRGTHPAGRGRDRQRLRGARCRLRRVRWPSRPRPAPAWRSRARRWAWPSPSSCR